jgi:hypothetical protein
MNAPENEHSVPISKNKTSCEWRESHTKSMAHTVENSGLAGILQATALRAVAGYRDTITFGKSPSVRNLFPSDRPNQQ